MLRRTWPSLTLALAACAPGAQPASAIPVPQPTVGTAPTPSTAGSAAAVPEHASALARPSASAEPSAPPSASSPAATSPAPSPEKPIVSTKRTARCQRDDQCAIELDYHCCGECRGVPLTAISAAADRKAQKESSRHCAVMDVDCSVFHCSKLPAKCEAHAVCRQGFCEVVLSKACEG